MSLMCNTVTNVLNFCLLARVFPIFESECFEPTLPLPPHEAASRNSNAVNLGATNHWNKMDWTGLDLQNQQK